MLSICFSDSQTTVTPHLLMGHHSFLTHRGSVILISVYVFELLYSTEVARWGSQFIHWPLMQHLSSN